MKKNYQRLDPTIIDLAVQELKEQGKVITIAAISQVTGYSLPALYSHPNCQPYRVRKAHHAMPEPRTRNSTGPTVELEKSVDSYVGYMRENHFSRPEQPSDVLASMQQDVRDLDAALWGRALNLLKVGGVIKESLQKDRWVSQVKQAANTAPEAIKPAQRTEVYFVMLGNELRQVSTLEEAEQTAKELLIKADFRGEAIILKPVKHLQAQLQIVEI